MKKYLYLFFSFTLLLAAGEKSHPSNSLGYLYLAVFILTVGLFFWGIYKAVKTQELIYTLALLPFFLLMVGMFFL